ncbi:MAG: hypothetical protein WDW38_004808 [Sanguina aurantia]
MPPFQGCEAGANPFVERCFHDCVYGFQDGLGFVLGMAAIGLWLVAMLPQFIGNIRRGSADGISVWFLAEWFLGDTLNLLGCLVQGQQLPTTTFLAMYFVLVDVVMLMQFIYLGALQKRRQHLARVMAERAANRHHHHHHRRAAAAGARAADTTSAQPPPSTSDVQARGDSKGAKAPLAGGQQDLHFRGAAAHGPSSHMLGDDFGGSNGSGANTPRSANLLLTASKMSPSGNSSLPVSSEAPCFVACTSSRQDAQISPAPQPAESPSDTIVTAEPRSIPQTALSRSHLCPPAAEDQEGGQAARISYQPPSLALQQSPCQCTADLTGAAQASQQLMSSEVVASVSQEQPLTCHHSIPSPTTASVSRPSACSSCAGAASCDHAASPHVSSCRRQPVSSPACATPCQQAAAQGQHCLCRGAGFTLCPAASARNHGAHPLCCAPTHSPHSPAAPLQHHTPTRSHRSGRGFIRSCSGAVVSSSNSSSISRSRASNWAHAHHCMVLAVAAVATVSVVAVFTSLPPSSHAAAASVAGDVAALTPLHPLHPTISTTLPHGRPFAHAASVLPWLLQQGQQQQQQQQQQQLSPWGYSLDATAHLHQGPDHGFASHHSAEDVALLAGTILGYLSSLLYLAARCAQISKNISRGTTEGMSILMFTFTIAANSCTGTSILLRLESATQLANQLPWMCGTFGTVSLDIFLLYQGLTMGKHATAASRKLLSPAASSGVVTVLDGGETGGGGLSQM